MWKLNQFFILLFDPFFFYQDEESGLELFDHEFICFCHFKEERTRGSFFHGIVLDRDIQGLLALVNG